MPKLLIVEDNELNRDMLSRRLQRRGYQVVLAPDGERGIAMAGTEAPDLILMDMSLPLVDGWEATRRLKGNPATRGIPIIGLSAHAMAGDEARARAAGCDDFATKPIDLQRLLAMIAARLGPVPRAVADTGTMPAARLPDPIDLRVSAVRDSLGAVLEFVTTVCAHFALDPDTASRVRLAIEEVATNVMDHGFVGRTPGELSIRVARGSDALTITVDDDGVEFDPAGLAPPRISAAWDARIPGGLGWHLTRKVMDDVRREARPGGGNRVTLVVRLVRSPA